MTKALGAADLELPAFLRRSAEVTSTGIVFPEGTTFEDWQAVGQKLQSAERSLMWWIGDWLRFGERRYGEKYTQAIVDITGHPPQSLMDAAWVASKFEISRRRENVSWSHHREVAALPAEAADRMLNLAESEGWSRNDLRKHVNQAKASASMLASSPGDGTCNLTDLTDLTERGVKFGTIYADPPWLYDNQATRASTGNHYDGLTVEQLCALPIRDLAADASHLHLWTTNGFLFDCPKIFEAWGFEFRSSFIWVKTSIGIGNYWRNSHEFLLTAVRGDAKRFNDHAMRSWLECERGKHSAKPEQVRSFIERASPGPYLELFGRRRAEGWAVWGNQIERTIFDHDVREVAA